MKRKYLLLFLICSLTIFSVSAQVADDDVVHAKEIYKTVDSITLTAHVFYMPSTLKKKSNTALAFFHGGGWAFGAPSEFFNACKRYASMGLIAVSFQYRLVKKKETGAKVNNHVTPVDCVIDARSALRWLRAHTDEYGIDPDKIVAGGQSMGGQLAWGTAMFEAHNDPQDRKDISPVPNAIISWSGTVNAVEPWCDALLGDEREKIWSISPTHNLKPGLPPAIAFHGTEDEQVDYWTVAFFARETQALGNHFELNTYKGRTHYLGKDDPKYATLFDDEILLKTDDFLKRFGFLESAK